MRVEKKNQQLTKTILLLQGGGGSDRDGFTSNL